MRRSDRWEKRAKELGYGKDAIIDAKTGEVSNG